ncbi:MAG: hypothetical protein ACI8PG_001870 [Planctomycetota bacterium]|jgi:hypothetical protein
MSLLKRVFLGFVAAFFLVSVTAIDPLRLSVWLEQIVGWQPLEETVSNASDPTIHQAVQVINAQDLYAHVEALSAHPSRVTGYPGAEAAAHYIEDQFNQLGLEKIESEEFSLSVPIDKGAHLRLPSGQEVQLYALWPNHVRTSTLPSGGIDGHLIDAGRGTLEDLNGQQIDGSIALIAFGSGNNYIEVRSLGAQAIIFYDDGRVTRGEAAEKFLQVPVDIPRFWVERQDAQALLARARDDRPQIHLEARMDWEQVSARNIYGILPGLDEDMPLGQRQKVQKWKDQILVVQAHYDAMSVVPALAPGAESATGIAALLETARLLKEHGTRYTVLFLATPGHFQALSGVNDFLYRHARKSDYFRERIADDEKIDFRLFIGLDLSSHSEQVATFAMGTFYNSGWGNDDYLKNLMAPYAKRFTSYNTEVFADSSRYLDAVAPFKRIWKNYMPVRLGLDSEAAIFVGKEALSFATPNQLRPRADTPLDRIEHLDFDGLTAQTRTIAALLLKAASDPDFFNDTKLTLRDWGHSLEGYTYWFDRDINFAVPKAPVADALVTYLQPGPNSIAGVRTLVATHASNDQQGEEAGFFKFDLMRNRFANRIQAFELDDSGRIVSAPDLGEEGDKTYPGLQPYGWWENRMLQVLFKCEALSFLEVVDPRYLSAMDRINVLGSNDAPPRSFGFNYIENQSGRSDRVAVAGVVFAEPGNRIKILAGEGAFGGENALSGVRFMLTNADSDFLDTPLDAATVDLDVVARAQGRGFDPAINIVKHPSLQAARDMWSIDEARIKQLERHGIIVEELQLMHERAREALIEAQQHLAAFDYTAYKSAVRRALGVEARIYPEVKSTANDTVRAVIFYFALILPFSFFCERFFFGYPEIRKQIIAFAGIFVGIFLILRWLHPAFKLSSSPYIIFLAFVILTLGLLVVFIVIGRFKDMLQKRKGASAGLHETDVGRVSAGFAAILLGISNLSKRRLRTALTAITLTLLTFTVSSFTSVKSSLDFYRLPRDTKPLYDGALVRDRAWRGMQQSTLDYVRSAFAAEALVVPRAWYLSQVEAEKAYIDLQHSNNGKTSFVHGLVGLHEDEPRVTSINEYLIAGRFFRAGDNKVVILPDQLAALLDIGPEDVGQVHIRLFAEEYLVIGLLDTKRMATLYDLDGEALTPVDTVKDAGLIAREANEDPRIKAAAPLESFSHLPPENTLFLPYEQVMGMEGQLRSIAVAAPAGSEEKKKFIERVESFMTRVALTLFVSQNDKVVVYSSIGSTEISGAGQLFVPVLIAALIVLNTMTGAVFERSREIGVYSVVGLAPSHIGMLFMAESTVYATFGAVAGYLLGQVSYLFIVEYELLSGLTLNYSSLSAVWATIIVIATVYISTLYPARLAASMAVPDVTRHWRFPDPSGDDWRFDFPFTVGGAEVPSTYVYLKTVFDAYGEGSVGDFIARDVELSTGENPLGITYAIAMKAWLSPYDLGISQEVVLHAIPTGEHNIYKIEIHIHRVSGDVVSWQRMNRNFLNVLRKRFLVWRTLPSGIRQEYQGKVAEAFAHEQVSA